MLLEVASQGMRPPHTINLLKKNCDNLRRTERSESKVTSAVSKAMIEEKVSPDVGTICEQKEVGKKVVGRSNTSGAVGDTLAR